MSIIETILLKSSYPVNKYITFICKYKHSLDEHMGEIRNKNG